MAFTNPTFSRALTRAVVSLVLQIFLCGVVKEILDFSNGHGIIQRASLKRNPISVRSSSNVDRLSSPFPLPLL
jgi:hypothetical protein